MSSTKIAKAKQLLDKLTPENVAKLSNTQLEALRKELNPYGTTVEGAGNFCTFSYTNIQEAYWKQFMTTAMVAFLNRMCDEWNVPDGIPVVPVYEFAKHPEKLQEYHQNWRKDEKVQRKIEENEKWMQKRLIVKEFLEHAFQFNPDEHVRSAYTPNPTDPDREVIETPAAKFAIARLQKSDVPFRQDLLEYTRTRNLMNQSKSISSSPYSLEKLNQLVDVEVSNAILTGSNDDKSLFHTVYNMIPATDTFHNFTHYYQTNYDRLIEAVNDLYCEKPDFDIAFNPLQWHDSNEDAQRFIEKHRNEVISSILVAQSGKWTFVAPYGKVRKAERYFNDKTKVLEKMMDHQKASAKLGQDMLNRRVYKQKKKNIEESGPDDDAIAMYKERQKSINNNEIDQFDMEKYQKELDAECPDRAIQVEVINITNGGTDVKLRKFFTEEVKADI
jgi:hypothetical protein